MALFLLLLIYINITHCIDNAYYNLSEWTQASFPSAIGRVMLSAIGYDLDHRIFIVGGINDLNHYAYDNVFIFETTHNTFIYQEHTLSEPVQSSGQSYCQINKIIYIINYITSNYIHTYDMSTWTFTANAYYINTTDDITYNHRSCLTNLGSDHLAIIGGFSSILQGNSTDYYESKYFGILNLKDGTYLKGPNTHYTRPTATCTSTETHLYVIAGGVWPGSNTIEMIEFDANNIDAISSKSWSVLGDTLSYSISETRSVLHGKFIYIIGGGPMPFKGPGIFHAIDVDSNRVLRLNNISVDHIPNQLDYIGIQQHMVTATYTKLYSFGGLYIDKFLYASFVNQDNMLPWEFETTAALANDTISTSIINPISTPSNDPTHVPTNNSKAEPTVDPQANPRTAPIIDFSLVAICILIAIVLVLTVAVVYLSWRNKQMKAQYATIQTTNDRIM